MWVERSTSHFIETTSFLKSTPFSFVSDVHVFVELAFFSSFHVELPPLCFIISKCYCHFVHSDNVCSECRLYTMLCKHQRMKPYNIWFNSNLNFCLNIFFKFFSFRFFCRQFYLWSDKNVNCNKTIGKRLPFYTSSV